MPPSRQAKRERSVLLLADSVTDKAAYVCAFRVKGFNHITLKDVCIYKENVSYHGLGPEDIFMFLSLSLLSEFEQKKEYKVGFSRAVHLPYLQIIFFTSHHVQ